MRPWVIGAEGFDRVVDPVKMVARNNAPP